MKSISIKTRLLFVIAFSITTSFYLTSCKKTVYPLLTNNLLNITSYIENDPTQFSLFDQMLQRTGYDGFLQAYGSYTIFVPNDDAVKLYMKSKGKTSVSDFNVDSLKDLVRYHVIQNDTISTTFFIDGKLRSPTMLNQYLTTGVVNINNTSSYIVNGQALILKSNVLCGNGVLHVIDHVLQPASNTLAQILSANPKYGIFTQALKATGYYDTINVAAKNNPNKLRNYFTVFAQSDSVYQSIGIPTFAALQNKYSALGSNPLNNPNDGLYNYVGFHILPENSYLTDILSKASHASITPGLDAVSDVLQNQTIQLCYDLINGVQYPGASVDRAHSNIPATNGVLHSILGDIYIKIFPPTRVDWDLADQPEFRKQTSIFRVAGKSSVGLNSPMTNIVWQHPLATATYICAAAGSGNYTWWNDYISLNQFRNTPNTSGLMSDVTFTTPVIIKGKYKVWISYVRSSETTGIQFYYDGNALQNVIPNMVNTYLGSTAGVSDSGPVLESKGWKRYTEAPASTTSNNIYNTLALFYCGVVNVTTTDRHLFRMLTIGSPNNNPGNFDMVQFIPIDQDQQSPRYFRRDGSIGN